MVEQAAADAARESLRLAVEEAVGKLTPRQREVAAMIAARPDQHGDRRASRPTPGTVANHIEHILRRLGYRSRAQVAALIGNPDPLGFDEPERRQA